MNVRLLILILFSVITVNTVAGEAGVTVRDDLLRQQPSASSEVVSEIKKATTIDIGERRGGWYQVTTGDGRSGWIRMIAVRYQAVETGGQTSTVALFGSEDTVTTGVRGLSDEELQQQGSETVAAGGRLVSEEEARAFAAEAGLRSREVGYGH